MDGIIQGKAQGITEADKSTACRVSCQGRDSDKADATGT